MDKCPNTPIPGEGGGARSVGAQSLPVLNNREICPVSPEPANMENFIVAIKGLKLPQSPLALLLIHF